MSDYVVFASDHPVTLRWTASDGASQLQQARLHDVSDTRLIIEVPWRETYNPPAVGGHVTAEAADAKGDCLAMFRGTVKSIVSRQIDIRLDKSMDVVQRRAHPRARVPFQFHSAILHTDEGPRYFLAHPLDLGGGGVRLIHRLRLQRGDRFRLVFRPKPGITLSLSAEVIQCQEAKDPTRGHQKTKFVTRAKFLDLSEMNQRFLARYVGWLISTRN
jgi:hypothetical protein